MCFAPQRRALFRHFFDIWTSKSGPRMVCFVHFDLEMCFAPQRRALFRHRNFQKWSGAEVFCTFWLGNVLRATTACTFSTSQLPKVVRTPGVLYILTWKCASHHNGVQIFISHLASWLRTRRFSEPTFRPSGATNHWKKHSVSRLSYLFAHLHLLSSDSFSSDLLSSDLPLLCASALLCFSSLHIVGSLTSKLPSIISEFSNNIFWYIWKESCVTLKPYRIPMFFWCFISFGCRIRTPLCGLSFFGVYACLMASWDATPDFFSWMWWSKLQAVSTMKIHSFPRIMIYHDLPLWWNAHIIGPCLCWFAVGKAFKHIYLNITHGDLSVKTGGSAWTMVIQPWIIEAGFESSNTMISAAKTSVFKQEPWWLYCMAIKV